ncbi:MAG: hypothetical protein IJA86_09965, partial [Clostridia bacterium]|nr:hypothetical protein [Clostridia bacterium]
YLRLDFYKFISAESKKSAQAVELPKLANFFFVTFFFLAKKKVLVTEIRWNHSFYKMSLKK